MKKMIATLTLALGAQFGQAHNLTWGVYKGSGSWRTTEQKGSFIAETIIKKDQIQSNYEFENNQKMTWKYSIRNKTNDIYDVISAEERVGEGYCISDAFVCHYDAEVEEYKIEETIVQVQNKLYKFGSKVNMKDKSSSKLVWTESLMIQGEN